MATEGERFLPALTIAAKMVAEQGANIETKAFTTLCDKLLTVFDYLGSVFYFAKSELQGKTDSLKAVEAQRPTLEAIVAADKAAGQVTVKNSCARNLHRLMSAFCFVSVLFEKLVDNPGVPVSEATSAAYDCTLAEIHTMIVRTAIRAGMWALPTREQFMVAVGETEETAKPHALEFISYSKRIVAAIEKLYDGPMPASTFSMWPM